MKLFTRILFIILCLITSNRALAQENKLNDSLQLQLEHRLDNLEKVMNELKKVTLSGYFQGQYIYAEKDAIIRLGTPNENPNRSFSRIGIRRARIKTTYDDGIGSAVFQLDITERGIIVRDAYLSFKDPWLKTSTMRGGIFFRPFGHDVRYSSSRREAPERARVVTTLFPAERDLGAMIQLKAPDSSPLRIFVLEGALIAGNGVAMESDSRRDFIGHFGVSPELKNGINLTVGTSYYLGSVYQGTENVYTMQGSGFVRNFDVNNLGAYARREYLGFDLQTDFRSSLGRSQLRAEYIFGQQPASRNSSGSPSTSQRPNVDTYIRNFTGGYVVYVHDLPKLPFAGFVRYDWYDPNVKVSGNNIGLNETTETDLWRKALGFGVIWRFNRNTELHGFYDINTNETTRNIHNFNRNLQDNTFTMTFLHKY